MSPKKRKITPRIDTPLVETPIKVTYERKNVKQRQILEFVPNTIKNGEAIVVRTKKWAGLSEPCFVVANNKGKVTIKQIKEDE